MPFLSPPSLFSFSLPPSFKDKSFLANDREMNDVEGGRAEEEVPFKEEHI